MARPVHCAMHLGITPIAMVYHWTMQLSSCQCWRRAKGKATNEIVRQHGTFKDSPDLPTAHTSDLPAPIKVLDVEKSPHADIWRHSMHQKFNGLLQAGTFAPAPVPAPA